MNLDRVLDAKTTLKDVHFVNTGCHIQTPYIEWFKIQILISHSLRGQKAQEQGAIFGSWCRPFFWLIDGNLLIVSSHSIREKDLLSLFFLI